MEVNFLTFSEDGLVTGPEWSVERAAYLVREMRKAAPAPGLSDLLVLGRIFYDLFTEAPSTRYLPVLSRHETDKSLVQAMIEPARSADLPALERAEAEDVLAASNIARWVLRLPQQSSPFVVFVEDLFLDCVSDFGSVRADSINISSLSISDIPVQSSPLLSLRCATSG